MDMILSDEQIVKFRGSIYAYYAMHKRAFPWRETFDPYLILVSEVMLQQTQTTRTVEKYLQFVNRFGSFDALATASTADVLVAWQGLGYNRRALYLKRAAEIVVQRYNGVLPHSVALIDELPGIGHATACAISTYAFGMAVPFIETNVRTVYLHHFFQDHTDVDDKELMPYVEETLDRTDPRNWYYALMDYGVMLKKTVGNVSRKSKHYTKQSKFEGSHRQLRGAILRTLSSSSADEFMIMRDTNREQGEIQVALESLEREGFISRDGDRFSLKK